MRHRLITLSILLAATSLTLCGQSTAKVVLHPRVVPPVDLTPFDAAKTGCTPLKGEDWSQCPEKSKLKALGCDEIGPDPELGGLKKPIVTCIVSGMHNQPKEYISSGGGLLPVFIWYVVWDGSNYRVIHSIDELKKEFGPIDSAEKALSFAVAKIPRLRPLQKPEAPKGLRYFVPTLESTTVTAQGNDWVIHNLYFYAQFGCGPHTTSLNDLLVTRDGETKQLSEKKAFEDPKLDKLCVD